MKKLTKLRVGLLLSTVLIMTVLGCPNPVSGGNDAGNGSGDNNGGGDNPSGEVTNPLLGTWATAAFANTDGKSVIRYYGFTEDILNITEVETSTPSAQVMSVRGERTSTPISKTIYEGSYDSVVDPNNPEKVDFSYETESGESVATTFTVSGGGTSEKAFSVETTTTTVSGVVTTEAKLEGTAKVGGIPGVATLVDLMGIWEFEGLKKDPYGDGTMTKKTYIEFTKDKNLIYDTVELSSSGEKFRGKPYEQSYTATFEGLVATTNITSGDSFLVFTLNENKTSMNMKSLNATKVEEKPLWKDGHDPKDLIGTWITNTGEKIIFTENQIALPSGETTQYSVVFDGLRTIILLKGMNNLHVLTFNADKTAFDLHYLNGVQKNSRYTRTDPSDGVMTKADLLGIWVGEESRVLDDETIVLHKEYYTFTESHIFRSGTLVYANKEVRIFSEENNALPYEGTFDGLKVNLTVNELSQRWTFNANKTSFTALLGNGEQSVPFTKHTGDIHNGTGDTVPTELIGTWTTAERQENEQTVTSYIRFDETQITASNVKGDVIQKETYPYKVIVDGLKTIVVGQGNRNNARVFTFNSGKTDITTNDDFFGGSQLTFTKATGATIVDLLGKWVVVYDDDGGTKVNGYIEYTEDKRITIDGINVSTGEEFGGNRLEQAYTVTFDGLKATVRFGDNLGNDYTFNEDNATIVYEDGARNRTLTKIEKFPTLNERHHDPEDLIGMEYKHWRKNYFY